MLCRNIRAVRHDLVYLSPALPAGGFERVRDVGECLVDFGGEGGGDEVIEGGGGGRRGPAAWKGA